METLSPEAQQHSPRYSEETTDSIYYNSIIEKSPAPEPPAAQQRHEEIYYNSITEKSPAPEETYYNTANRNVCIDIKSV